MANHASADKRFRQSEKRRLHNKYYARTTRNAIKAIRNTTDKAAAEQMAPKVFAMIDKLAKTNVIHKNKAANLKSGIALYINKMA
jgi:small subunit ribosomal protein S20